MLSERGIRYFITGILPFAKVDFDKSFVRSIFAAILNKYKNSTSDGED
jgi:hypothetical protein